MARRAEKGATLGPGAPGARRGKEIFRTAGKATILPGRVHEDILGQWRYLDALSSDLGKQDRSSIYGGFHVYERASAR